MKQIIVDLVAYRFYYLRARYYDPANGRFTSQDPYSGNSDDPISLHRYLYANADPVNNSDPTGQMTLVETIQVAASISLLAAGFGMSISAALGGSTTDLVNAGFGGYFTSFTVIWAIEFEEAQAPNIIISGVLGGVVQIGADAYFHSHYPEKNNNQKRLTAANAFGDFLIGFATGAVPACFDIKGRPIIDALWTGGATFVSDLLTDASGGNFNAANFRKDIVDAFGNGLIVWVLDWLEKGADFGLEKLSFTGILFHHDVEVQSILLVALKRDLKLTGQELANIIVSTFAGTGFSLKVQEWKNALGLDFSHL